MRTLLILLAALLIGGANVSSQEPSNHKSITHKEQKAEQKKATPKKEVTPVNKTQPDVGEDARHPPDTHTDDKLKIDRQIAEYTRQLSIYTKDLSVYTESLSKFTLWLVIATFVVAGIGIWQGFQLKCSVDLARKEFIATHRPRLMVRRVEFIVERGNTPVGIRYTVHNAGDSEGTITAVSERLWIEEAGDRLSLIPSYGTPKTECVTLKSGGHKVYEHIHPDGVELGFQSVTFLNVLGVQDKKPMFLGYVDHKDQSGLTRRTAFLREYDPTTRRFNPVQHPDYEYQD